MPDEFDESDEDYYMTDDEAAQENTMIMSVVIAWIMFAGVFMLNLLIGNVIPSNVIYLTGIALIIPSLELIVYLNEWS